MTTPIESRHTVLSQPHAEPTQYTRTAMVLHWVIAVLIICNAVLGLTAESFPDGWIRPIVDTHKSIGITVLGLALLRILWRVSHRAPPLPREFPTWEKVAAHVAHFLLYVLMIVIPVSGYLYSSAANIPVVYLGLIPLPRIIAPDPQLKEVLKNLHIALNYTLLVLVALHVVAAIKHQLIDRDGLLSRMLPFLK